MSRIGKLGAALFAAMLLAPASYGQDGPRPPVPMSYRTWLQLKDNPEALRQLSAGLPPVAAEPGPAPAPPIKPLSELRTLRLPAAFDQLTVSNSVHPASAQNPSAAQRTLTDLQTLRALQTSPFSPEGIAGGLWSHLANVPPGGPYNLGNPLLLTDGTVIAHNTGTPDWYKLTPSNTGSYINGTWTRIASMQSGYAPTWFASAVLPDGRVIVEGGEWIGDNQVWTAQGAIYEPTAGPSGTWTEVKPPVGWKLIGDAQSTILAEDGTFMLANCCDVSEDQTTFYAALLNPADLTWRSTGTHKADLYDEESWTMLADGNILTVDAYTTSIGNLQCGFSTERYDPKTGAWSAAGDVPKQLSDCNAANAESGQPSNELGPQVLMYNGKVIVFGGTTANVAHTALYNTATKTWAAGPDLPSTCTSDVKDVIKHNVPCNMADAPATLLPNGNVLLVASPGKQRLRASFFEYDPTANTYRSVLGTSDADQITSYYVNFLTLPTGQILAVENFTSTVQIYTPSGNFQDAWRPVVTSAPACVVRGNSDIVNGKQLNGLSQSANYGDDQQAATNYPLVRIVNNSSGHVFYARTYGHSTMSVAANALGSTHFQVAKDTETGPSRFYVVANGIPSVGMPITIADAACPVATNKAPAPNTRR
jgi:hypothetical protein